MQRKWDQSKQITVYIFQIGEKGMSRMENKEDRSKLDLCCIRESLVTVAQLEIGGG